MLKVENVQKRFGKKVVLSGVNLEFGENRIYGLLGRNGAGKSTLLNIINNRLQAGSGTVTLDEEPVFENDRCLSQLFLVNDKNLFPKEMKVKKAFALAQKFYPGFDKEECQRLSELFELNTKAKIAKLSTGYQSIFRVILAICMPVRFVFLDEPVLGLDATHRDLFYTVLLENYGRNPRTIVLSTHLIEEVAHLVEGVFILHNHKILMGGPVEDLLGNSFAITGDTQVVDKLYPEFQVIGEESLGNVKTLYVTGVAPDKLAVIPGIAVQPLNLQKLFVELTKQGVA
ncbi:MAG: ABC transporter ATP-binding protein [Turicibacter sp.]|nr:ABC transporter ATP-binding protein [Turicibacter sp.]